MTGVDPFRYFNSKTRRMGEEMAIVDPKHVDSTFSGDVAPSPPVGTTPVASIPVSMVVHGGTGILHGNMTNLTVNQYIGVVPNQGGALWDNNMVRELVADAVKIGADANKQLMYPSDAASKPTLSGIQKKLVKGVSKRQCLVLLPVLIISSIVVLVSTSFYTKFSSPVSPRPVPVQPFRVPTAIPVTSMENTSVYPDNDPDGPRIYPRSYWLAQPAKGVTKMVLPMTQVIVHDTMTEVCYTITDCQEAVRNQQRYSLNVMHLQDIVYNFMIGGDGNVYQGRGWDRQGEHIKHHDVATLGVALIGFFNVVPPNKSTLAALARLINIGVVHHKISPNYTISAWCQMREDGYQGKALALALSN